MKLEFDKDVTDRATAKAEARPYIDVLDYFDITNPVAPQFNPKNTTTRGQFASFLYKTSNVEVGEEADTEAPKLVYTGEDTINVEYNAEFTAPVVTATDNVDEEVEVTSVITNEAGERLTAIDTKVPGTYKVTYSAVDAAGNSAEDVVVTVVVGENPIPEVVSVEAANAKEIVIQFNSALDKVTAEVEANYSLTVAGVAETNFTAVVDKEDASKVVLTLTDAAALANNEAIQLKVKKEVMNSKLNPAKEDYSKTWVFSDTTAPVITNVVKEGNDLKVTFDDFVASAELAKVNGSDFTNKLVVASVT